MLGFQDFTSTNSYSYDYGWGYYYDPLMTTALLSDLNSPYSYGTNTYGSYGTIAGATPVSNSNSANSDLAVVDSLLAEAFGIFQGSGTSATAPVSSYPSPNTATVGSVGVGHKTGDPLVDSLLNQSDQLIADDKSWLDSLPKDPLTNMPVSSRSNLDPQVQSALGEAKGLLAGGGQLLNSTGSVGVGNKTGDPEVDSLLNLSSQAIADSKSLLDSLPILNSTGNSASMLPSSFLYGWLTPQISMLKNPNTTDPQLKQMNDQNIHAQKVYGSQAMLGATNNSIKKSEQRQNEYKFKSMGDVFNHEQIAGPDGYPSGHRIGNKVSLY